MKDTIKRILIGCIVLVITLIIMILFIKYHDQEKEYTYITMENEWGTSNECYAEDKILVCKDENKLIRVRQFYYEK